MASKRRLRRNACIGKVAYPDRTYAVGALIGAKRRGQANIRTYKCQWGSHWHIGHFNPGVSNFKFA